MCRKVLLVDDNICLAYAIQSYLSSKDRKIFIVNTPTAALQLLNLYTFDLVISDIMMPHMDGYKLLEAIRLNSRLSTLPFIFLTAKGMTIDRIKGYDLGCNFYLTKPFHPSELLSIVNNVLNIALMSKSSEFEYNDSNCLYFNHLTPREVDVLHLLARGMMNKEIASRLDMTKRNVEKYVSRLLIKTNTRNRTELARLPLSFLERANDGTRTRE